MAACLTPNILARYFCEYRLELVEYIPLIFLTLSTVSLELEFPSPVLCSEKIFFVSSPSNFPFLELDIFLLDSAV